MSSTDASGSPPIDPAGSPSGITSAPPVTSDPITTSSTTSEPIISSTTSEPITSSTTSEPIISSTTSEPPTTSSVEPPTTSSQTTSPTAGPGGSSNPGGTTSPPVTTTSPDGGSPAPATSSAVLATTLSTSTNADGSLVIQTITETSYTLTSATGAASSAGKSNVGPIVGGVVGGVVGLLAILVGIFLLMRRRKRNYREDFDDMMFDPARAQNHGPIDLADDHGAPTIDPYDYKPSPGIASTMIAAPQHDMTQAYPHSASDGVSRAPSSSAATSAGFAGYGAGGAGMAGLGAGLNTFPTAQPHSPTSDGAMSGSTALSAKQLEAYQEAQRFRVQNPGAGPSAPGGPVTVHQDGGAFTEDAPTGSEIPPTYDSIRR